MSLTQEQIKKIAENLSKVPADDNTNINNILNYFSLLEEVDTSNVEPTYSVITKESSLRKDIEKRNIKSRDLLACSKEKIISDQIAISNIMK